MATSKRSSPSNTHIEKHDPTGQRPRAHLRTGHVHVPMNSCKDQFSVIEPQINAEGVHVWPFDVSCPVDVLFLTEDGQHSIRMNRHSYFEILYLSLARPIVIFRTGFFLSTREISLLWAVRFTTVSSVNPRLR